MAKKITSVLELARYKVGDQAFRVAVFYPYPVPDLPAEEACSIEHPKSLFAGPFKRLWPFYAKLPRLAPYDFDMLINILISKLRVEEFIVADIIRSDDTGEFLYFDGVDDWVPEDCLFDSMVAALREKSRILQLFKKWANNA